MTINSVRTGIDALANAASPDQNYGRYSRLAVKADAASDERQSFLFFGRPWAKGSTIVSAVLRLYTHGDWSGGSHTLSVERVAARWAEGTLSWNRRPAVAGAAVTEVISGSPAQGTLVEVDVTSVIQAAAAGSPWFGLRLSLDTSAAVRRFFSSEAAAAEYHPELVVEWSRAPLAPVDLRPSGNRAVSLAKPVLTWRFRDREGDTQSEAQVQIDNDAGLGSPLFDSGWVSTTDSQLDLADTAFGGLAEADVRYWRVRVKDEHGLESPWSDISQFRRVSKGTLTIDNPGATTDETTPPIETTLTGQSQTQIRHILEEDDGTGRFVEVYRRRRVAAPAGSGTPYAINLPEGVIRRFGRDYRLTVDSWDGVDRVATPGDPVPTTEQLVFELVGTPAVTAPTNVAVDQEDDGSPGVIVTWDRATAPDYFAVIVDGEILDDRIDPAEASTGGTSYRAVIYSMDPNVAQTVEVRAVEDNGGVLQFSNADAADPFTPVHFGIWLVDTEQEAQYLPLERGKALEARPTILLGAGTAAKCQLVGGAEAEFDIGESGAVHNPTGRRDPVYIVDGIRGYEGSISGRVMDSDHIAAFRMMKGLVNRRPVRLVAGYLSVPVILMEASVSPTPVPWGNGEVWNVAVSVAQVGEFDIEVPR